MKPDGVFADASTKWYGRMSPFNIPLETAESACLHWSVISLFDVKFDDQNIWDTPVDRKWKVFSDDTGSPIVASSSTFIISLKWHFELCTSKTKMIKVDLIHVLHWKVDTIASCDIVSWNNQLTAGEQINSSENCLNSWLKHTIPLKYWRNSL